MLKSARSHLPYFKSISAFHNHILVKQVKLNGQVQIRDWMLFAMRGYSYIMTLWKPFLFFGVWVLFLLATWCFATFHLPKCVPRWKHMSLFLSSPSSKEKFSRPPGCCPGTCLARSSRSSWSPRLPPTPISSLLTNQNLLFTGELSPPSNNLAISVVPQVANRQHHLLQQPR